MQALPPATPLKQHGYSLGQHRGGPGSHAVSPPPVRALCIAAGDLACPSGLPAAPSSSELAAPEEVLLLRQHPAMPALQQLQSAAQVEAHLE